MRYVDLLRLRDQTIEDRFLAQLEASDEVKETLREKLGRAMQEANTDLAAQLETLFGNEEARRILEVATQANV